MKKIIILSAMVLIWVAVSAQISDTKAISLGVNMQTPTDLHRSYRSPTFDPAWADRFQTVLDSVRITFNMKGVSMAVMDPIQGLWTGVSGNSIPGVPITGNMRFGICSNGKLFTSAALLHLQEQGVLSLDDHIYQWLPSYPYIDSTATIRQLLSHQTGYFDYMFDRMSMLTDSIWADTSRVWTQEELIATVGLPHFAPGHGYSYSNTNYLLAGMVIDAATGSGWVQQIHDFIIDPLEMDSTFIGAYEPKNGPVAAEWDFYNNRVIINSPMTAMATMGNAAGDIFSIPQEITHWYSSLFSGMVVSDSSLVQITSFEPTSLYGLGILASYFKDHLAYNHIGSGLGYCSLAWYDVQTKAAICILMNDKASSFEGRVNPLLSVFYDEYPKKPNDAGISTIIAPRENICSAALVPSVILKNFGSDPLSSVDINYKIDEGTPVIFSWTGALIPGDTAHLTLPAISPGTGFHTFTAYTSNPNGAQEGYLFNDTLRSNYINNTIPALIGDLSEGFEGVVFPPSGWTMGSSSLLEWGKTQLASYTGSWSAARGNYNDKTIGARYDIDLPMIHIAEGTHPILQFEYAYAMYPGMHGDSLQVFISADCGVTWQKVYNNGGDQMNTAPGNLCTVLSAVSRPVAIGEHSAGAVPGRCHDKVSQCLWLG